MIHNLAQKRWILFIFGIFISIYVKADTWEPQSIKAYYSDNKQYKLVVYPTVIPEKYNHWKYYKSNKYPQTKRILRKKEKFMKSLTAQDTILIHCRAELYQIKNTDSTLIWNRPLLNNICPVHAIVADDGSSIATFDNWFSRGYGVNVFVVYNENGDALKTYKLEEITPYPLNDYKISISSLHWLKEAVYNGNDRILIVFKTEDGKITKKNYNANLLTFEE